MEPILRLKEIVHRPALLVLVVLVVVTVVIGVRSKFFGTRAKPSDYFPAGFAGELVKAHGGAGPQPASFGVVGVRNDGSLVFTPDTIRFKDRIAGIVELSRPDTVSGDAELIFTYGMRGPVSNGFTDVDAKWVYEISKRNISVEARARAITLIAFAITSTETTNANTFGKETEKLLVERFESALVDGSHAERLAALNMSDWTGWSKASPTFVDSLRRVASGPDEELATKASYILVHTFGLELPG